MRKFFRNKISMAASLVLFVFLILLCSGIVVGCAAFLLIRAGLLDLSTGWGVHPPVVGLILLSILLGTTLAAILSRRATKPVRDFINATQQVAAGDFTVHLEPSNMPEFDELTESFNKMVQDLAGIETLRSDFIGNFSHEFKTPIVSIRGFAKLLQNPNLSPGEREEYVGIIIEESERLVSLSTNVLSLSKLENLEIVTEKETFSLDEQIRKVVLLMEPHWKKKQIFPLLDLARVDIFANADMLQQVWVNLLDNAIKYCGNPGKITISLQCKDQAATVVVSDNGAGMDEHTHAHLFEKFYQGDASRSALGNGLGLAMVKRIVELCNGTVSVNSEPGKGSAFTVSLPITQSI